MKHDREASIREILKPLTTSHDAISWLAVLLDVTVYVCALTIAVTAPSWWLKLVASVVGGTAISMLFILGHDANHLSLFRSRRLNTVMARLMFLPCMHNTTLWRFQHNWLHHQYTNVRAKNSFSPLSLNEYQALSRWGRLIQRMYRNPIGFGIYYLIERWWNHKFLPWSIANRSKVMAAWCDFIIILIFGLAQLAVVLWIDAEYGQNEPLTSIFFALLLPFLIWNQLMGTTAFLQHTHPRAHWNSFGAESRSETKQVEHTIWLQCPAWYDLMSHNIMQHPAHHVSARIPWYNLKKAQSRVAHLLEDETISEAVSISYFLTLLRTCQLYDYEQSVWLDFAGNPTASEIRTEPEVSPAA